MVMARRPTIRLADLKTVIEAMKASGMEPAALDVLPDGTHRWHFTKPADNDDDDLDRELKAYREKHGYD
jgi:hypothetical protein